MNFRKTTLRLAAASALVATVGIGTAAFSEPAKAPAASKTPAASGAAAAEAPIGAAPVAVADPTKLLPVSKDYHPKKTLWGEPNFTGMWPIDSIASIPFARGPQYGNRFYLNQSELNAREKQRQGSLERYEEEAKQGKIGMGHWAEPDRVRARESPGNLG